MTAEDKLHPELTNHSHLLELIKQTNRYSICEVKPGQFEVMDHRYLLDRLLQFPELRPTKNASIQIEFEEALEDLSSGPMLTLDDVGMLDWLVTTMRELDPKGQNTAFKAACLGAVVLKGTFRQVEYFLRATLDHRVQ